MKTNDKLSGLIAKSTLNPLLAFICVIALLVSGCQSSQSPTSSAKISTPVNRTVNNYTYNPYQNPAIRDIIETHEKQGHFKGVPQQYNQLLWASLKTYGDGDSMLIPLLNEISLWHLNAYIKTGRVKDLHHIEKAFHLYSAAIELSSQYKGPLNLELITLLKNQAVTRYYYFEHQEIYQFFYNTKSILFGYQPFSREEGGGRSGENSYSYGLSAHSHILKILEHHPNVTPKDKAEAYANLGDWHLLFWRDQRALNAYQRAHQIMSNDQQRKEVIDSLFGTPTLLPHVENLKITAETSSVKEPNNNTDAVDLTNTTTPDSYINLSVDVTEKGKATNFKIESAHPKKAKKYSKMAKKTIHTKKFRPRFESGSPVLTNAFPIKVLIPNENS